MEQAIIRVEGLKKVYRLGTIGSGLIMHDFQSWLARRSGREDPNSKLDAHGHAAHEDFTALDGIDLKVKKGERLGIIGANGAGKSTFLKILSRITAPTEGAVYMNGKVSSMLEVGTGFHEDLTGRENIYLNGSILGMKRAEIDAAMEDIIDFSECRQFIDTPVKRYSSGMLVKLGFAVAAHLNNEILIMDEVLAVGDLRYQQKCIGKMSDVSEREEKTILYVSHIMSTVRQLCNRCIVLSHGKVIFDGDVESAIGAYMETSSVLVTAYDFAREKRVGWTNRDEGELVGLEFPGKKTAAFTKGEPIRMDISWRSGTKLDNVCLRLLVRYKDDSPVGIVDSALMAPEAPGTHHLEMEFDGGLLAPGSYYFQPFLFQKLGSREVPLDWPRTNVYFEKLDPDSEQRWDHRNWGHLPLGELRQR